MAVDLDRMSEKELKDLRNQVDRALVTLEARQMEIARKAAEDAARAHGFQLAALMAMKPRQPRETGSPKYANPDNPSQTWTGRGRKPGWIKEGLAKGKSLGDFAL